MCEQHGGLEAIRHIGPLNAHRDNRAHISKATA
jgi:hypothetical protein